MEAFGASEVGQVTLAAAYVFCGNCAVLSHDRDLVYAVRQVPLAEHYRGDDAAVIAEIAAQPYADTAVVDRRSACHGAGHRLLTYRHVDLRFKTVKAKDKTHVHVTSILRTVQPVAFAQLLQLADLASSLSHSEPKRVLLYDNIIFAVVDVFLNDIGVGEAEVVYPGRFYSAQDAYTLKLRAQAVLLARGDYGFSIKCSSEVKQQFGKGVFSGRAVEAAAELLRGVDDFLGNEDLIKDVEATIK